MKIVNLAFTLRVLLLCLLTLTLLTVTTPVVLACSCAMPETPSEEMTKATAVFAALVTTVETTTGNVVRGSDPVTVTFQVAQVWKGPRSPMLTVTTARDGATCGYSFSVDDTYLVYAHGDPEALTVSLCSRTAPLINALDDLYTLGEGQQPQAEQPTPTPFISPLSTPTTQQTSTPVPMTTPPSTPRVHACGNHNPR